MYYTEAQARELVIQAGVRLLKTGLIARTWGNISARISDTQFVITPSGLAYDTLRPEQLVVVDVEDCSYEGEIKPSSEKGIHADAYRLRPNAAFIIHTHQHYASAVGVSGQGLRDEQGKVIPCAAYGLPSTKKLRQAVVTALKENPYSNAILLHRHGTLCIGRDYDDAFSIAAALEETCKAAFESRSAQIVSQSAQSLGSSKRCGGKFSITLGGRTYTYPIRRIPKGVPHAAQIHAAIYRATKAQCIAHETDPGVIECSRAARTLHPLLDDLAQIAGATIRCADVSAKPIVRALLGRNAVLVKDCGALCIASDASDLEAIGMILRKGCAAQRYAFAVSCCRALSAADAHLQRWIYVCKYSAKKGK